MIKTLLHACNQATSTLVIFLCPLAFFLIFLWLAVAPLFVGSPLLWLNLGFQACLRFADPGAVPVPRIGSTEARATIPGTGVVGDGAVSAIRLLSAQCSDAFGFVVKRTTCRIRVAGNVSNHVAIPH